MVDTIVPVADTISLADAFFGRTRQKVLGLLFEHPDESFYLREVARRTGQALGAVQRDLAQLSAAGIVDRTRLGNQVRFSANAHCPIYPELKSIVTKTIGAAGVLKQSLLPLADRIRVAFIFGSLVRGQQRRDSDVDLLVVGKIAFRELSSAIKPAEQQLARPVNPVLYSVEEFEQKRNHFINSVLREPKILLIGSGDELGPMV